MCGIGGILDTNGLPIFQSDLETLVFNLAHRGPDGAGIWKSVDGSAAFVHRRLAILDTSDLGLQPMHSPDHRYTIVYNGEIFNFIELRAHLEILGSTFRSDSDTEVILEAWRHWGEGMLLRFNGMWAFAIRDNLSGEVFLARDRFGVKPLLYSQARGRFAFASEMRALRGLSWVNTQLDHDVARRMLFDPFGIEGSDQSIFASISRLPAGHFARWKEGRLAVGRWWRTVDHLVDVPATQTGQAERFHDLFVDAVRLRMRSDVTIGTCLSGGFDSSAIVCAMSDVAGASCSHLREAKEWRHAFIASFPARSIDETPMALEAAAWADVKPHILDLGDLDATTPIDTVLRDLDDVYISLPAAPWHIYREVRRHGTVVSLDGHGADELMGGYRQSGNALKFALQYRLTSALLRSAGAQRAIDRLKLAWLSARGLNFLRGSLLDVPRAMELPPDRDQLPSHWGALNRHLHRMFHSTVLPTILRNFDRLSMAHGVEVRMPFMDWRLVTYVMSLPDASKLDGIGSKAIARHAMSGRMPESIRVSQRKVGFNSPMPEWLNASLGEWALRVLNAPNDEFDSLVDQEALLRCVRSLNGAKAWDWENVGRVWPYLNFKWLIERATLR